MLSPFLAVIIARERRALNKLDEIRGNR